MVWAKYNSGLSFWQRNNDVTRKHLTHKNTSLSNAVYSNAQLRVLWKRLEKAHNYNFYHQLNFVVWTTWYSMLKFCLENFPSLKSSKTRVIILNICFKIQLYRPNKHSYDTPATTSSLQCKNILKNFVVNEKQRKYNSRKNHTPCQLLPKSTLVPVHFRITHRSARHQSVSPPSI